MLTVKPKALSLRHISLFMKRFTLLIFFIVSICGAFAQNISVKSFKALPMDLTASSLEGKRQDQNGDVAALIKVVTTETGFVFEGGTLGIVDTKQTPGEVWVWVPRAARKITIKHPKLGVLRDYYYPVEIEAERTYEMVLTTAKIETVVKEEVRMQYLAFQISPPKATLLVDEKYGDVEADGSAQDYVNFGTYSWRVEAPNYHSDAGRVTVDDPNNAKIVTVTLQPNFGWIEVAGTGNLKDASVYVDNVLIGRAPCKSEALKSGKHTVRITKKMYATYTETVTVADNETTRLAPSLTADFAEVTLTVDADAEIFVNDERKGTRSWTGPLGSGTYKIECKQANHETSTTTKEITAAMAGQTITLPAPRPIYGSLNVESIPNFCKLYIDGKDMGTTPKSINEILIGQHELKLTKEGYADHTETVTIAKGDRKQVKATLTSDGSAPMAVKPQEPQPAQPEQPKPQQPTTPKKETNVFFVMANAAYSIAPQTSFGLTVGSVKRWGWYVSLATNFKYVKVGYECTAGGLIYSIDNNCYRYTKKETMRLSLTAGAVARIAKPVYAYLGAGYGVRNLLWHFEGDAFSGVAKNKAYSHEGVALDAGMMFHLGHFSGSLGVQTVNFGYVEAKIGIGLNF